MRTARFTFVLLLCLYPLCAVEAADTIPVVVRGAPQTPDRYVVMTGTGIVRAMPDTAIVSGGVVTRARHAADALRANNETMTKVVAALKERGVPSKDITTSSFTFEPQYETDSKGNIDPDRRIVAYRTVNRVNLTLREKLEQTGELLDVLIQSGANDSATVLFEIRDFEAVEMQAREAAAKNALARAQAYCRQVGAELGAVRSIREGAQTGFVTAEDIGALPDGVVAGALRRIPGVQISAVPITAEERTITKTVTIVWALK